VVAMQTKADTAGVLEKTHKPEMSDIFKEFGYDYQKSHKLP